MPCVVIIYLEIYEPPLTQCLNFVNYTYLVVLWFVDLYCLKDLLSVSPWRGGHLHFTFVDGIVHSYQLCSVETFLCTYQHLLQSQVRVAVDRGSEIQFFLCFVAL